MVSRGGLAVRLDGRANPAKPTTNLRKFAVFSENYTAVRHSDTSGLLRSGSEPVFSTTRVWQTGCNDAGQWDDSGFWRFFQRWRGLV